MFLTFSRKSVSQKLSILLLAFGLIWGLMLLRYMFLYPRHQSSSELREQILDLSRKYVKALTEENKDLINGGDGGTMAGFELLVKMTKVNFLARKNMKNTKKQCSLFECKTDCMSAGDHQKVWTASLWDQRLHASVLTGSKCSGFHSSFTCGCAQPAYAHETVVETKEERLAQGKPVGKEVPYAAMGGLTGFSSLAEGYMRLDDSGIGAPSNSFLESSERELSHPFLRAYDSASKSQAVLEQSIDKQVSNLKLREEEDMAYFEKRYQERLQKEKEQKRQKNSKAPSSQHSKNC